MRLSTGRRVHIAALLLGAAAMIASAIAPRDATAYSIRTWLPVTDGSWSPPANWSPNGTPTPADSVIVTSGMNGHSLALDSDFSAGALQIQGSTTNFDFSGHNFSSGIFVNAGIARLNIGASTLSGPYHSLAGAQTQIFNGVLFNSPSQWQNDGHAVVHSTAGVAVSELRLVNYTTYSGTGDLQLNDAVNAQITSPSGYTLTQSAGHTIHGAGRVLPQFTNHGNVIADLGAGAALSIENTTSSDGVFGAANGSPLVLSASLSNAGGLINANGGDVQLKGAIVSGGTYRSFGTSVIDNVAASSTVAGPITSAATFRVNSGTTLNMGGVVTDSGSVLVHQSGGATLATLRINNYTTFQGPGEVKLTDPALAVLDSPSGYTVTQDAGHTIHGAGKITLPMVNHSLISADLPGQTLLETNTVSSDGTLDARNGATLLLQGATVTNGGVLQANGGDVQLDGASVTGGTISASGGNAVTAISSSTINGNIVHSGALQINGGSVLSVGSGTFANSGNILVKQPAGITAATLRITNFTTFSGAGSIQLTNPTLSVFDSPSNYTVTQNAGHTTHGTGIISLPVVNHGLISADVSGQTLTHLNNSITNDGTLQATAGGTFMFTGATITNTGGAIKANGGNVQFNGVTLTNGTLSRTGSNIFEVTNNTSMADVTHSAFLRVDSGKELQLTGSTFTNTGTVQVREPGGSAAADLRINNFVTLAGTGTVQLTDAVQSSIISPSNYTVTQAATHSIVGTGVTSLPIVNHGLVNANVAGQPITMSNSIGNDGTLQASNGGRLVLIGVTLSSTGVVTGNGGDVFINNSSLQANTFTTAGANKVILNGSNAIYAIVNKAAMQVNGGTTQTFNSSFADSGTIVVHDTTTGVANLRIANFVTLSGNGVMRLTDGHSATIDSPSGYTFTQASGHSIRGTGNMQSYFFNSGDVWADQADSTLLLSNTNTNAGRYAAINRGILRVTGTLNNISGTTLTGGEFQAGPNSQVQINLPTWRTDAADVVLEGHGSKLADLSGNDILTFLNRINAGGSLTLRNDRDFTVAPTDSFINAGTLVLGDSSDFAVTAAVGNRFTLLRGSRLVIELAGHGSNRCGHLVVPGLVQLQGRFIPRLANGFVPAVGDSFLVMDFNARNDGFAGYDSMAVAPGVALVAVWKPHQLWLRAVNTGTLAVDDPPAKGPGANLPKVVRFGARSGAGHLAQFELDLPAASDVEVGLFDVTGRRVATLASGSVPAGRHAWPLDASGASAAGVYFGLARISSETGTQTLHARVVSWR